jgi:hypothetical protein
VLEERICCPYGAHALEVALGYKHAAPLALEHTLLARRPVATSPHTGRMRPLANKDASPTGVESALRPGGGFSPAGDPLARVSPRLPWDLEDPRSKLD